HNVHPSLVKWLGLPAFCPTLPLGPSIGTFRLGTLALVSIFFFALYLHVSGLYGESTAFFASVLLFFTPRVFAHLHFAATDAPLTALWAWTFFSYRTLIRFDPWRPARLWATGILLGLSLSVKFTAVFLAPLLFLYGTWIERRPNLRRDALVLLIGAAVFYVLNPDYWRHPLDHWAEFVGQSIARKDWAPISTLFFGTVYHFRPPFYFAPVLFVLTTPLPILALMALGVWRLRRFQAELAFLLMTPVFFLILLALPGVPVYDGDRLFMPVMPFMAVLAGAGLNWIWTLGRAGRLAAVAMAVFCLAVTLRCHPYQLVYYNTLIGGPEGARRAGMESEYWWSSLTPRDLKSVSGILENRRVAFWPPPPYYGETLQAVESTLPKSTRLVDPADAPDLLIVLGRPQMDWWWSRGLARDSLYLREFRGVPLWGVFPAPPKGFSNLPLP
ncbi:glycosyltransferase family 39 protein, partial [bacterium]|nr:glycosyltransferase family 39 protein [bacterium]